jgi:ADP-ribose pyrophosphatase YjhB (NUDIX family)
MRKSNKQGERALFVRQAKGHPLEGQWSIPWGIVDPEESPERAVLREIREEGGIAAEIVGLLGIQNLPQQGWVGIVFLCRHIGGVPKADGVETDRAAYFSLEEMKALNEPFEPWCEWVVRRVLLMEHRVIPPVMENPYRPRVAFL